MLLAAGTGGWFRDLRATLTDESNHAVGMAAHLGSSESPAIAMSANELGNFERDEDHDRLFEELLSTHQHRIYGYIFAMLRDTADAQDVLQQTAVILWKKFDQFDPETNFFSWAVTVARYEVLNFTKYRRRSRVYFNQDLMEQLAGDASAMEEEAAESRRAALKKCLKKLAVQDRKLIESRYSHGLGSRQMAEILGRSHSSVCNSLRRIREALHSCIEHALLREDSTL